MKPEDVSKFDEASACIAEQYPPFYGRLYLNCVKEGFTDEQAMRILLQIIPNARATT